MRTSWIRRRRGWLAVAAAGAMAVVVPAAAVQSGILGTFVYRVNAGDNTVSVRKIQAGPAADGRVALLSGLAAGDVVVIDGADHLSDGAKVAIPAAEAPKP